LGKSFIGNNFLTAFYGVCGAKFPKILRRLKNFGVEEFLDSPTGLIDAQLSRKRQMIALVL